MVAIVAAVGLGVAVLGAAYSNSQNRKAAKAGSKAANAQGKAQQGMNYFEATQMEAAAGQQQAMAQRNAQDELRKSAIAQSQALAIAGASGAGASDPDVTKLLGDIAAEGDLAANTHLYNGDEAAKALKVNAKMSRWQGDQARKGLGVQANAMLQQAKTQQLQTILNVAGSAATWYAGRPTTAPTLAAAPGGGTPPGGVPQQSATSG